MTAKHSNHYGSTTLVSLIQLKDVVMYSKDNSFTHPHFVLVSNLSIHFQDYHKGNEYIERFDAMQKKAIANMIV